MDIIVAVTAGLFSLLGAFSGAWLARRTDYEKWLRESRSQVFAQFLKLLSDAKKNATDIIYSDSKSPLDQGIGISEAYILVFDHARVVRLYLPKPKRKEFQELVNQYWALHDSVALEEKRFRIMEEKLDAIQKIFEDNLGIKISFW